MIHINRFIDKIKFFESKNSKDFIIPLQDAKDLHADITKLLIALREYEQRAKRIIIQQQIEADEDNW
jgi:hypothetical protein